MRPRGDECPNRYLIPSIFALLRQVPAACPTPSHPRPTDVAALRIWNKRGGVPGRREHLVIVRRFCQKPETKYILSNAKADTASVEIAYAGLERWTEERCFGQGKDDLGLAQYQTETWPGWHRRTALVTAAHSFLIGLEIGGGKSPGAGDDTAAQSRRPTGT
jgi:hypothetical protein